MSRAAILFQTKIIFNQDQNSNYKLSPWHSLPVKTAFVQTSNHKHSSNGRLGIVGYNNVSDTLRQWLARHFLPLSVNQFQP